MERFVLLLLELAAPQNPSPAPKPTHLDIHITPEFTQGRYNLTVARTGEKIVLSKISVNADISDLITRVASICGVSTEQVALKTPGGYLRRFGTLERYTESPLLLSAEILPAPCFT